MDRIERIHLLTKRLIIMTALSVLLFATLFAISFLFEKRFMLTWAGFLCGIIGGFVSIQQRIRKVSNDELVLLTRSWFQILLVPIFGGVFSLVLYALFLSEIVSGDLFPEFAMPKPPTSGPDDQFMLSLFTNTYPETGQDLGKFLFWSFVAGFSERLVPQIISKVAATASESDDKKHVSKD
ncbi:MAG: hypothetical protein ACI88A_003299 [Paraglaciecola sp.]|jgi:hypothetical protein